MDRPVKVVVLKVVFGGKALGSQATLTESSRLAGEAVVVRLSSVGGGGSRHGWSHQVHDAGLVHSHCTHSSHRKILLLIYTGP